MSIRMLAVPGLCAALLIPLAHGQRKELVQLQRDMALIQDTLRQNDLKNTERLVALEALVKQSVEKEDKLSAGQAVIERRLAALDDALSEPQRSTAANVDALTEQFSTLRATVEEMGASVERLQADVRDIKTHLTTLPPPLEGEEGEGAEASAVQASEAIFEGGMSDYLRGNIAAARGQFQDYLTLFGSHSKAPDAQYYLAETFYSAAEYEEAARQFDTVYKRYPLSKAAPDSLFKKGQSLANLRGRADEAIKAYQSVLERFPDSNASRLARAELNRLQNSKPSPGL